MVQYLQKGDSLMILSKRIKLVMCISMLLVVLMVNTAVASVQKTLNNDYQPMSTIGCNFMMSPEILSNGSTVTADGDATILVPFAGTYHFDMMLERYFKQPYIYSRTELPAASFQLKHKDVWFDSDYCWNYDSGVQYIVADYQKWINLVAKAQTQTLGRHRGKWGSGSFAPDVWRTSAVIVN
jgi:hypothetical protein